MASREPMWYCHQCDAEMRPLMMPHPVCASCRGDFVERMEDPNDDPREFAQGHGNHDGEDFPPGVETILFGLQQILDRGIAEQGPPSPRASSRNGNFGNSFSIQYRTGSGSRQTPDGFGPNRPPTMSEFLGGPNRATTGGTITGPLMTQYLMTLLGHRPGDDVFGRMGFGDPAMSGRMGDYVFSQEALDQIITQLMNESNAHRPVPAPEDVVSKLPREKLDPKSATLEKDCAVCKEQFKLNTEDPAEQFVITLPCRHPFHEPCILPWLKSSGTCPVCRYALVPQPDHQPSSPSLNSNSRRNRSASSSSSQTSSPRQEHDSIGIWQSFFSGFGRPRSSAHTRSNSDPTTQSRSNRNDHLPGSWEDDLD
ncbi:hypothetical protein H2248_001211 [Termitomyces sp. 'cryptogamus']|nr:hypothetical protein H2248_001211 [Termitomyces sp. 'cryptogamus']